MAKIELPKIDIGAIDAEAKERAEAEAALPPEAAAATRIQRPDPAHTAEAVAERLAKEDLLRDRVSLHFAHVPRFIKDALGQTGCFQANFPLDFRQQLTLPFLQGQTGNPFQCFPVFPDCLLTVRHFCPK